MFSKPPLSGGGLCLLPKNITVEKGLQHKHEWCYHKTKQTGAMTPRGVITPRSFRYMHKSSCIHPQPRYNKPQVLTNEGRVTVVMNTTNKTKRKTPLKANPAFLPFHFLSPSPISHSPAPSSYIPTPSLQQAGGQL